MAPADLLWQHLTSMAVQLTPSHLLSSSFNELIINAIDICNTVYQTLIHPPNTQPYQRGGEMDATLLNCI